MIIRAPVQQSDVILGAMWSVAFAHGGGGMINADRGRGGDRVRPRRRRWEAFGRRLLQLLEPCSPERLAAILPRGEDAMQAAVAACGDSPTAQSTCKTPPTP